ncbi:hypothetical protein [Pseudalkalibacillus sp. SCS-8]|uniref:hypothetical protein n=1 Tax=Pseudalkalibacillus nanhaiensis TaxID=3115291 RepID=UPI0032DBC5FF
MKWFKKKSNQQEEVFKQAYIQEPPDFVINGEYDLYCIGANGKSLNQVYQEKMSERMQIMLEDPELVNKNSKLKVEFFNDPPLKMTLQQWVGDEVIKSSEVHDYTFQLPDEAGIYAYDILIEWEEGYESFAFVVKIS